jgi:hypothetical protein
MNSNQVYNGYSNHRGVRGLLNTKRLLPPVTGELEFIKPEKVKRLRQLRLLKYKPQAPAEKPVTMKRIDHPKEIQALKLRASDITERVNGDGITLIKSIVTPMTSLWRDKKRSPDQRSRIEEAIEKSYIKQVEEDEG